MSATILSFFESIGNKALWFVLLFGILMNAIIIMMASSGAGSEFINALPKVFGLDWVYSSVADLSSVMGGITTAVDLLNPIIIATVLRTVFAVMLSIVSVVVSGYIGMATYILLVMPSALAPLTAFITVILAIIQFSVWLVMVKTLINLISQIVGGVIQAI